MSDEHRTHNQHSDIHLPSPTPAPIIVAAGATFVAAGLLAPPLAVVGLLLMVGGIVMWAFGPR